LKTSPLIEAQIQKPVIAYARSKLGLHCTKMDVRNSAGIPDYLIWMPWKLLMIEFKRPGAEPTPLQVERHKQLRKLGYEIHVVDNIVEGKELLRRTLSQRTAAYQLASARIPDQDDAEIRRPRQRSGVARPRAR
jgi:hypothetical protein